MFIAVTFTILVLAIDTEASIQQQLQWPWLPWMILKKVNGSCSVILESMVSYKPGRCLLLTDTNTCHRHKTALEKPNQTGYRKEAALVFNCHCWQSNYDRTRTVTCTSCVSTVKAAISGVFVHAQTSASIMSWVYLLYKLCLSVCSVEAIIVGDS